MNIVQHVRRRLLAGLVLIVPIAVTLLVAGTAYRFLVGMLEPLLEQSLRLPAWRAYFESHVNAYPALRVVATVVVGVGLLYLIGLFSTMYLIRRAYGLGERAVMRIPVVKSIYGITKQVMDLVTRADKGAFKQVVLVEYPRPGCFALAFVTGEVRFESDGRVYVNVFMPTTPNPTSGFLMILPREQVQTINMSVEAGVKMIISGGVITPGQLGLRPYGAPEGNVVTPGELTRHET